MTTTGDGRLFSRELTGDQIEWRIDGKDWPQNALTMVGLRRLGDLQRCVESVVADGVEGDLIEAGSWRGGASMLMRATLDTLGAHNRTVWVADSFQGFPAPEAGGDAEDRELDRDLSRNDYLAAALDDVRPYFARLGLDRGVQFVPGFFEDTLGSLRARRWALIRLDGDTYKATRVALDALYPGLSVGGYVIVDEYHHPYVPMCRRAVDDFRREHEITEPIEEIGFPAGRWRRESEASISAAAPDPAPADDASRSVPARGRMPIPTDRELQLGDEVAGQRERLAVAEAELERLRGSPIAGLRTWARTRLRR